MAIELKPTLRQDTSLIDKRALPVFVATSKGEDAVFQLTRTKGQIAILHKVYFSIDTPGVTAPLSITVGGVEVFNLDVSGWDKIDFEKDIDQDLTITLKSMPDVSGKIVVDIDISE